MIGYVIENHKSVLLLLVVVVLLHYYVLPYDKFKLYFFNTIHKHLYVKHSFIYIWKLKSGFIGKKTHNFRTLTKSANVSPITNAITNLQNETIIIVDYDNENEKKRYEIIQTGIVISNIIQKNINLDVYISRYFLTSGTRTLKYIINQSPSSQFSFGKGQTVQYLFVKAVPPYDWPCNCQTMVKADRTAV
jgi:hypothetical protein